MLGIAVVDRPDVLINHSALPEVCRCDGIPIHRCDAQHSHLTTEMFLNVGGSTIKHIYIKVVDKLEARARHSDGLGLPHLDDHN